MNAFLIHKFMRGGNNLSFPGYLMQDRHSGLMYIGNSVVDGGIYSYDKITFTIEEIKKIKEENKTELSDFYIIADTDKNREILFWIKCEAEFNIEDFELVEVENEGKN